jgi:hypothetical protein
VALIAFEADRGARLRHVDDVDHRARAHEDEVWCTDGVLMTAVTATASSAGR